MTTSRAIAAEPSSPKVVLAADDSVRHRIAPVLRSAGYDVVELPDCEDLVDELLAGPDDEDNPREVELLIVHGALAAHLAQTGLLEAQETLPPVLWLAANSGDEHLVVQLLRRVDVVRPGCSPVDLLEAARRILPTAAD